MCGGSGRAPSCICHSLQVPNVPIKALVPIAIAIVALLVVLFVPSNKEDDDRATTDTPVKVTREPEPKPSTPSKGIEDGGTTAPTPEAEKEPTTTTPAKQPVIPPPTKPQVLTPRPTGLKGSLQAPATVRANDRMTVGGSGFPKRTSLSIGLLSAGSFTPLGLVNTDGQGRFERSFKVVSLGTYRLCAVNGAEERSCQKIKVQAPRPPRATVKPSKVKPVPVPAVQAPKTLSAGVKGTAGRAITVQATPVEGDFFRVTLTTSGFKGARFVSVWNKIGDNPADPVYGPADYASSFRLEDSSPGERTTYKVCVSNRSGSARACGSFSG